MWPSLIVCTILSSLSLQFFSFLEQPFYENYPTLDSSDTKPFTRQDGFQNRHKVKSIAYGSTKIEFLIFQNNRVFSASAFFSVQFKSNKEYFVNTVNPLLSPPGGLFFSGTFEGGLNREGGLKREGGLI